MVTFYLGKIITKTQSSFRDSNPVTFGYKAMTLTNRPRGSPIVISTHCCSYERLILGSNRWGFAVTRAVLLREVLVARRTPIRHILPT